MRFEPNYNIIPPYKVDNQMQLTNNEMMDNFPLVVVDKGSYAVDMKVESPVNFLFDENTYMYQKGMHNFQIGRYSSIASDVLVILNMNHDTNGLALGAVNAWKDKVGKIKPKIRRVGELIIGNDVWIGNRTTILDDIVIHDGAVVGAGALVTKDVPPYAIVGGPARVIRYRYPEDIIKKLQKIRWWYFSDEKLKQECDLLHGDIAEFLECEYPKVEDYYHELENGNNFINNITTGKCYCFRVDLEYSYSLTEHVVEEFVAKYSRLDAHLVLWMEYDLDRLNKLYCILEKFAEMDSSIQIIDNSFSSMESIILNSDVYITRRSWKTVSDITLADIYDKLHVAGCAYPIFE